MKTFLKTIVVKILQWEARLVLKKYKPKIIGITGSVGKTSVKEATFSVLSKSGRVRKSDKSYNSELGVPLTIIGRPTAWKSLSGWIENIFDGLALVLFPNDYPEWLVLEIGADRPKDIKNIVEWVVPDIAVITRLPDLPVHIEFFESKDELIEEKLSLARAVKPDGTVVLNIDDENIRVVKDLVKAKVITYGFDEVANVRASDEHFMYEEREGLRVVDGMTFKVNIAGDSVPIRVNGALGRHHIYTALAAISVGIARGLNIIDIADSLSFYVPPSGRMRIIDGIKKSTIIDDTYNASPAAMEAGIIALSEVEGGGRKIAVLGDMMELGEHTIEAHKAIGDLLIDKVSDLFLVGMRAKFIAEGAKEKGFPDSAIKYFDNALLAGKALQNEIGAGDLIYIKGSQSMRMEKVVEEIMAHPEDKEKLLCRQEKEWQRR